MEAYIQRKLKEEKEEWKVKKLSLYEKDNDRFPEDKIRPRMFLNMPKQINQGWSPASFVGVPDGYFSINHCNTKWMMNVLTDTSDRRLMRLLKQEKTRKMFESDIYYQMCDEPAKYLLHAGLHKPMFHSKALLYLNAFGIAIYLHRIKALNLLSRERENKSPLYNPNQNCYATCVNDTSVNDVLIFRLDYLLFKREAYSTIQHLLAINWRPGDPTNLVYRRRYFQYVTPFLDWVDVLRHLLRAMPSLQLSRVTQELAAARSSLFKIDELKEMGQQMLEYFEVKKLPSEDLSNSENDGKYAGRKLLRDKEISVPDNYRNVFRGKAKRPIIPHATSAARRFLCYSYYYDHEHLSCLSQILSAIETIQRFRYFTCERTCIEASWHKDPLIFQIYEIVNLRFTEKEDEIDNGKPDNILMREQPWSIISSTPHMRCWFHRFDILNCISLLFGILQNCIIKNFSSKIIDRICRLLLDIMVTSELIEPFLTFSYYDTYFALTTLVNCVPGLQSSSIMRLMKRAPMMLTAGYSVPQLSDMFSSMFWTAGNINLHRFRRPRTLNEIGEFLVTRKRLISLINTTKDDNDLDRKSSDSAMGSSGAIVLFERIPQNMVQISQAEEQLVDTNKTNMVVKAANEAKHRKQYIQTEIEFRYSNAFGMHFRYAAGRPKVFLDEEKTMNQCLQKSRRKPPT